MSTRTAIGSRFRQIDILAREFWVVSLLCITITALNALVVAFTIGYGQGRFMCGYPDHYLGQRDLTYEFIQLEIEVALLVIAIALRLRRVVGFYVSIFAAVLIEIQYVLWFRTTQRVLGELGVSDFSQLQVPSQWPNFAGLYQGTPWDIVVLVFTSLLLVWQVRVIIAFIARARRHDM